MNAPPSGPSLLLLRPWLAAALPTAGAAIAAWALERLLPSNGHFFPLFAGVTALMAIARVAWRDDADKAVVRALVTHSDPGPRLRDRAAAWARAAQHPRASDRWSPLVVVTGLAAACVVVAVVRGSWPTALPAPFLLGWCAALGAAQRVSAERAARWLADPPVPADDLA